MKKRPELLAKSLSGLTAFALMFSSVPTVHIHAEDMEVIEEFGDESVVEEYIPAVYTITEFIDFQKDGEGKFIDEETKSKYGSLSAEPGTPLEDLGLPEDLVMNGYYEADGPDVLTTLEILDVDWILKSDIDETYSEATPEGSYFFIPDFDTYVLESDVLDEIKVADGLKMLEIPVTIALPVAETEAPAPETEYVEPVPAETEYMEFAPEEEYVEFTPEEEYAEFTPEEEYVEFTPEEEYVEFTPEEEYVEPAPAETEYVEPAPAETEYVEPAPAETEYVEPAPAETEYMESTPEEDIFSDLDDSMLGIEDTNTIITYDQDGNMIEVYTDPSLSGSDADPNAPVGDGTAMDDGIVNVPGEVPEENPSTPEETPTAITFSTDFILTDVNGNPIYSYAEAEQALITLSTDVNVPIPAITISLGCGADLTHLNGVFDLPEGKTLNYSYTEDPYAYEDFSQQSSRMYVIEVTHEDYSISSHKLSVTVEKADHIFGEAGCTGSKCTNCDALDSSTALGHNLSTATCTAPATCQNGCGYTEGSALGHNMSSATCTAPATCQNGCGYTEGSALGHNMSSATCSAPATCQNGCGYTEGTTAGHTWIEATCTTPKTCDTCGAVEGEKLGHDWLDATCTDPKTCDTCGAVKGEKLGHDWLDATCTDPKTCDTCGATKGKALGHELLDDWQTTKNSTDSVHGEQVRYCHRDDCDYSVSRALNIIGNPANNAIANLAEGAQYNLNTKITFTAIGAAMGNTNPINGDVRYVPTSWNIQNTPGTFMNGYTGAFSITKAGSYTVSVTFQKQIYQDGWKATDVVDSKAVSFTVGNLVQGNIVQGTADGIKINPQTGDTTQIIPFVIAVVVALAAIISVLIYKKKRR